MMNYFRDLLIVQKLKLLLGLLIGSFAVIALVYVVGMLLQGAQSDKMTQTTRFTELFEKGRSEYVAARVSEKDFFNRPDAKLLENQKKAMSAARQILAGEEIRALADDESKSLLTDVVAGIEKYDAAFRTAVEIQRRIGLNENEGAQDAFRKAAHEIEAEANKENQTALTVSLLQMRRHEKDFMLREDVKYLKEFQDEAARFASLLASGKSSGTAQAVLKKKLDIYREQFQVLADGMVKVKIAQATFKELQKKAEAVMDDLVKHKDRTLEDVMASAKATQIRVFVVLAIIILAVAALVTVALLTISREISGHLGQLHTAVEKVSAGDMTARSRVLAKNELGSLSEAFDSLLDERITAMAKAEAENEQLNNSVILLLESVFKLSQRDLTARAPVSEDVIGTVSDSVNQLAGETDKVLQHVTQIARRVAESSATVREQSAKATVTAEEERKLLGRMTGELAIATEAMSQVADLAGDSNRAAEQATNSTKTALQSVTSTVKGMDSIRETISETEKRIKRLGERSQEISGIVGLINTISERTHVLALNASMQAAISGEAGRGFAVVAEEVQRLAESSRNATQQIATLVNNIQTETADAILTVNRTISQVVEGSRLAQQSGEQMQETQESTARLVEMVQRIVVRSQEQMGLAETLKQRVGEIDKSTAQTEQELGVQSRQAEVLAQFARDLVESVGVFRLSDAAV